MRLLEQDFPSAPESLLQQFLGAPSSGCVALRHAPRTGPDSGEIGIFEAKLLSAYYAQAPEVGASGVGVALPFRV